MPWYKSGLVSVVLNSNAVIGTGTAFIANSRVGDAFRGPDGGWYEVTNIASDTALSISPNYQGATNAAGIYALAPMQGYVKDSADALRALVNTYGSKLAALGTTGNYDTLPINKGGTGGTDQASARSGLGLGSAAVLNAGTAIGNAVQVGAFGVGSFAPSQPVNLNNITVNQDFTSSGATLNVPIGVGTAAGQGLGFHIQHEDAGYAYQKWSQLGTYRSFERSKSAGTWLAWVEIYHQRSAVGTVSQVNGVPTGAIVEYISGANGAAVRWADGTQICVKILGIGSAGFSALGSVFFSSAIAGGAFAANFIAPPACSTLVYSASGTVWDATSTTATATAFQSFYLVSASPNPTSTSAQLIAHGRWFA